MTTRQFDSYRNGLLVGRKTCAKTAGIAGFFKELFAATYVLNSIGCVTFFLPNLSRCVQPDELQCVE